jgi:hypothetical protein
MSSPLYVPPFGQRRRAGRVVGRDGRGRDGRWTGRCPPGGLYPGGLWCGGRTTTPL